MCHLRHILAVLSKNERVFLTKNSFSAISTGRYMLRRLRTFGSMAHQPEGLEGYEERQSGVR